MVDVLALAQMLGRQEVNRLPFRIAALAEIHAQYGKHQQCEQRVGMAHGPRADARRNLPPRSRHSYTSPISSRISERRGVAQGVANRQGQAQSRLELCAVLARL